MQERYNERINDIEDRLKQKAFQFEESQSINDNLRAEVLLFYL